MVEEEERINGWMWEKEINNLENIKQKEFWR